jgi:hypothetical protein
VTLAQYHTKNPANQDIRQTILTQAKHTIITDPSITATKASDDRIKFMGDFSQIQRALAQHSEKDIHIDLPHA